jgi:site-specific DNA recombinase
MTQQIVFAKQKPATILHYCIYARKSMEAEDRQAISIDSQLSEMRKIVDRDHLNLIKIKTEAHSAKNSGERPIFLKMIEEIRSGKYNAILTWNPDRLSRNAGDLGHLVDLMDKGLLLEIRTFNQIFSNSPNDKFMLMILCSQAKLENDNRGINVRRGLRTSVERGLWPCSQSPIGYVKSNIVGEEGIVHVDAERALIVKQVYEKVINEGKSIYDIVQWLKKIRFTTRAGKFLNYSMVQVMVHKSFYYGVFEYPRNSGKWYKGIHKPIITKELYDAVQEKISAYTRKKKYQPTKSRPFAFTKIIKCGSCGSNVTAEERHKILKTSKEHVIYRQYMCNKSKDRHCRERIITEEQLMPELYKIIDQVEIDEIGMRDLIEPELEKWYKVRAFAEGKPYVDRNPEKKDWDTREYAKIFFEEGTIEQKREILKRLTGRLMLNNKKVYLDKLPEEDNI